MWWVLTSSAPVATFNSLTCRTFTNVEDHLFMAWAYHQPRRHLIYRTVRGKTVLCGYKYIWDTPFIQEQDQPGDTLYHTFRLTNLQHNSTIWYYLWAPDGPYGLEIQGPLRHVHLPPPPYWPEDLYVATRAAGVFATRTFSGPGEPQPTWIPISVGLHSPACWHYAPDLLAPKTRHFLIAGLEGDRILYKLDAPIVPWWIPFQPGVFEAWEPLLTNAQAQDIAGFTGGDLAWVTTNFRHPGHVYALLFHEASYEGAALLKSQDYGATWTAHQISVGYLGRKAGNITAGISRGSSPYPAGSVLYASCNLGLLGTFCLYRSLDIGHTWSLVAATGLSVAAPRCTVDPTNCSTVYSTSHLTATKTHELLRSTTSGYDPVEVDGPHSLGFFIDAFQGQMWISPGDRYFLRVLIRNHPWTSSDFGVTWTDHGLLPLALTRLSVIPHSPPYLYLARNISAPGEGLPGWPHVIFISDDEGANIWGKAGDHADQPDGGGDSIPFNCGGLAHDGFLHPTRP